MMAMSTPSGAELGGVGVAQAMSMDALVDARPGGGSFQHDPDVGIGHRLAAERAEDRAATQGDAWNSGMLAARRGRLRFPGRHVMAPRA